MRSRGHEHELGCKSSLTEAVVFIEDDGRVAYAYFWKGKEATCICWLYNRVSAEGNNKRGKPHILPDEMVLDNDFEPPKDGDRFGFAWKIRDDAEECGIYLRGKLLAILRDGQGVGWSANAAKDSDLAWTFEQK